MPTLTRRAHPERQDCWHVFYGDVHVGTMARRSGCPIDVDQWEWSCGLETGMIPGLRQEGTSADLDACRIDFEAAWHRILPTLTETDFRAWRDARDQTGRKHEMWKKGCKLPTQMISGKSKCFCGAPIDIATEWAHVREAHGSEVDA